MQLPLHAYALYRCTGDNEPLTSRIAARGQSLTEFAKSIGMDPRTLHRCLRGAPVRYMTYHRIGAALRLR